MEKVPGIEDDDWPLLALKLYGPGPNPAKVFSLLRLVTSATADEARNALHTPGHLIATDSGMALRRIAEKFQKLGADVRIESLP